MFIGQITGSVVSTQKVEAMVGQKLLIVEPLRIHEETKDHLRPTGRTFVVVDTVGAGEGEVVLCVQGSSARFTPQTKQLPVDAAIIGIVDRVQLGAQTVFHTGGEDHETHEKGVANTAEQTTEDTEYTEKLEEQ